MTRQHLLVDLDKCGICSACVSVCPHDALEMVGVALRVIQEKCTLCYKCIWFCPVDAFRVETLSAVEQATPQAIIN